MLQKLAAYAAATVSLTLCPPPPTTPLLWTGSQTLLGVAAFYAAKNGAWDESDRVVQLAVELGMGRARWAAKLAVFRSGLQQGQPSEGDGYR